jgi:hypothetical protein
MRSLNTQEPIVTLAVHDFPTPKPADMAALVRVTAQQQHDAAVLDRWVRRLSMRDRAWLKKWGDAVLRAGSFFPVDHETERARPEL